MTRVLVTGATGFVGRHATRALEAQGAETIALCRGDVDLLDPSAALPVGGATHLLHLAWCAQPPDYLTSPDNTTWLEATQRAVKTFLAAGGRRVVLAGSQAEYASTEARCDERTSATAPATPYGVAKLAAWQSVVELGVDAAEGRLFQLYGPGEDRSRLVPAVATALLRGEEARTTTGEQRRDFLHVADAADALARLTLSDVQGPVNIASGTAVAVADVVRRLATLAGRPELIRLGAVPSDPSTPPVVVAAVDRLRDEVGWAPVRTLDEGLADALAWWRRSA